MHLHSHSLYIIMVWLAFALESNGQHVAIIITHLEFRFEQCCNDTDK